MGNKPERKPTDKQIMDQTKKQRYFIHWRDLKFFIGHGIRVKNIHIVSLFKQFPWLAKYTKHKTEPRFKAKTEFKKPFYKVLNNAFCWKKFEKYQKTFIFRFDG